MLSKIPFSNTTVCGPKIDMWPINMVLLKNPQFLPNFFETWSKWPPCESVILTKSQRNRIEIVYFLIIAYFWARYQFCVRILYSVYQSHVYCLVQIPTLDFHFTFFTTTITTLCTYAQTRGWPGGSSLPIFIYFHIWIFVEEIARCQKAFHRLYFVLFKKSSLRGKKKKSVWGYF